MLRFTRGLDMLLHACCMPEGIPFNIPLHAFRHTFACLIVEATYVGIILHVPILSLRRIG